MRRTSTEVTLSGIFRRNRTETGLEFWDTAVEIKREAWRGYVGHMNAHKTIRPMDRLYFELFGIMPKPKKGRR